jgi:hypothetical protein
LTSVSPRHLTLAHLIGTARQDRAIAFRPGLLGPPDFMHSTTECLVGWPGKESRLYVMMMMMQEGLLLWTRHKSLTSLIPESAALLPFPFWKDDSLCTGSSVVHFWKHRALSWESLTVGIAQVLLPHVMPRAALVNHLTVLLMAVSVD